MTKFLLIACATGIIATSCNSADKESTVSNGYTQSDNIVALHRSTASLDRMLVTTEDMIEDMHKMNHKLNAIFQAVTGCEDTESCEMLKQKLSEEAELQRQGN